MTDVIYEIYTDDSGAFTVGCVAAQNEDDIVIRGHCRKRQYREWSQIPRI